MEDIVTKKCEVDGCFKGPDFGFGKESGRRCEMHKDEGMVRKRNAGRAPAKKDPGKGAQRQEGGVGVENGASTGGLLRGHEMEEGGENGEDDNAGMYQGAYG